MMRYPNAKILIFAKTPVVGQVKTRLIPALGEEGAYQFHLACMKDVIKRFHSQDTAPTKLLLSSTKMNFTVKTYINEYSLEHGVQSSGDLGQRMQQGLEQALVKSDAVVLIGSDAPALNLVMVENALRALYQGNDVVMVPAEDGGYVLLGLAKSRPELFNNIPWGTDQVASTTRQRCLASKLRLKELDTLWDVDRPEDLQRLKKFSKDWSQHLP